ncbi:MAG TPA: hypothetical protein VGH00_05575 [Chthoniobacterales bacterium]
MNSREQIIECFELMERLIEYRYDKPLHHRLMKAADYSMLDIDVLVLIYHMAKICDEAFWRSARFWAPLRSRQASASPLVDGQKTS